MIEQHANRHADRITFPPNQGKDYIIKRSKYTKMAYGRLGKNFQNAEDAVNNAYLKVLEHPPRAMSDEEFESYFTVVLMSTIIDSMKSERQREISMNNRPEKFVQYLEVEDESDLDEWSRREEIVAIADEELNPETSLLAKEMLAVINQEIGKLKFSHRQIIALNVLYGYKPREVQGITGESSAKIRMTIHRFRETMKEKLQ